MRERAVEWIVPWAAAAVAALAWPLLPETDLLKRRHPYVEDTFAKIAKYREPDRPLVLIIGSSLSAHAFRHVETRANPERCAALDLDPCPQVVRLLYPAARLSIFDAYLDDIAALQPVAIVIQGSLVVSRPIDAMVPSPPQRTNDRVRPGPERTHSDLQRIRYTWGLARFGPEPADLQTLEQMRSRMPSTPFSFVMAPRGPTMRRVMPTGYANHLRAEVERLGKVYDMPVLRTALDIPWKDEHFFDYMHLNKAGSDLFRARGAIDDIMRLADD